jgi:hypothetical protein
VEKYINDIFNPSPSPVAEILAKWDRMAIEKKLWDKRKTIWTIMDIYSGFKVDRLAILAELETWKKTGEVEKVKDFVRSWKTKH